MKNEPEISFPRKNRLKMRDLRVIRLKQALPAIIPHICKTPSRQFAAVPEAAGGVLKVMF